MLGHMACRTLAAAHDLQATVRTAESARRLGRVLPSDRIISGFDSDDEFALERLLASQRPQVVLNCIGIVKQRETARHGARCVRVNALFPHLLADALDASGGKLIHFSTDCVFSGRRGDSGIVDFPDATDLYGRSKLLGEVSRAPHLTLRTSMIGRELAGQTGLLEWFLAQRGGRVSGYAQARFSGLTTRELCRVIGELLARHESFHGLWHLASAPISKYDLLVQLNSALRLGIDIAREDNMRCDRTLNGAPFAQATGIRVASWNEMIADLAKDVGAYEDWRC